MAFLFYRCIFGKTIQFDSSFNTYICTYTHTHLLFWWLEKNTWIH